MTKHKFKFDKRRALECKMIGESDNIGEYLYELEIGDRDGEITKVLTRGVDMQDAISRHIWTERSIQIVKVFTKLEGWFILAWFISLAIPSFFAVQYDSPSLVFAGLFFSFIVFGFAMFVNRYVNRKND